MKKYSTKIDKWIDSVALKQFNYGHFTAAVVLTFRQTGGGHRDANPLHGRNSPMANKHNHSNTFEN